MAIRYAFPGVRFAHGRVALVPVPIVSGASLGGESGAPDAAPTTITGAQVVAALAADGVDTTRW